MYAYIKTGGTGAQTMYAYIKTGRTGARTMYAYIAYALMRPASGDEAVA